MQTSMGQAATMFSSLDDLYGESADDGDEEPIEAQLLQGRKELLEAVRASAECLAPANKLVQLKCPFTLKYSQLNIRDMLKDNSNSLAQLKAIPVALNMLEKYGRHLLKPPGARVDQWRQIKFNNPIFKDRVSPVIGALEVVQQMGYSEPADCGLQFALDEPDVDATCNIVADIILARNELELYLTNKHPHPEIIRAFMPKSTIDQLIAYWDQMANMSSINPIPQSLTSHQFYNHPNAVSATVEAEETTGVSVQTSEAQVTVHSSEVSDPTICSSQPLDDSLHKACDICGETAATVWCRQCDNKQLCNACDDMWHRHPKRQNHERESVASLPSPTAAPADNIMGPFGIRAPHSVIYQGRREISRTPPPLSGTSSGAFYSARSSHTPPPPPSPPPPSSQGFGMQEGQQQQQQPQAAASDTHAMLQQHQQQLQFYQQLAQQQQQQQQQWQQPPQPYYGDYHTLMPGQLQGTSFGAQMMENPVGSVPTRMMRGPEAVTSSGYAPPPANQGSVYPTYPEYAQLPISDLDTTTQRIHAQSMVGPNRRWVHIPQPDYNLRMSQQSEGPVGAGYTDVTLRHSHRFTNMVGPVAESSMVPSSTVNRSASSYMSESTLLRSILEESNYEKRAAKCDVRLLTLDEELQAVEVQVNDLLLNNPDCIESEDFKKLTRNKARLMKETEALSTYKKELADLMAAEAPHTPNFSGDPSQTTQIFHPPNLSSPESVYGSYQSQQVSAPYPAVSSPNQIYSSAPFTSPTHLQLGFSYPHQASHSPVHVQEPIASSQTVPGRSVYGKPQAHVSYHSPNAQESLAHIMQTGANSSVDQTSILPQWQMNPSMMASSVARPTVTQPLPYPAPRYQHGDYSNSAVNFSTPLSYTQTGIAVFGTPGPNTPVAQEHGMTFAAPPHLGESHSSGDITAQSHPGLSRLSSAPTLPGHGNTDQGAFIGFENFLAGEEQPHFAPLQPLEFWHLFGKVNAVSPSPGLSQFPPQRPSPSHTPSPPPVRRSSPVGQSAARFSSHEHRWECTHCTYINDARTRVCTMCDRTSDSPTLISNMEISRGQAVKSFTVQHAPPQGLRKMPVGAAAPEAEKPVINQRQLNKFQKQIAEEQDQVYLEKKEAHEQFYRQQQIQKQQQISQAFSSTSSSPPTNTPPPLPLEIIPLAPQPPVPPRRGKMSPASLKHVEEVISATQPSTAEAHAVLGEIMTVKEVVKEAKASNESPYVASGGVVGERQPDMMSLSDSVDDSLSFIKEGDFGTTMERFSEHKRMKEQQLSGAGLLHFVKMADRRGFLLDEMQAALEKFQSNYKEALNFLCSEWEKLVEVIVASAHADGQKSEHNDVGDLSKEEARKSLGENKGDMVAAVKSCVARRKQLYKALNPAGTFAREEVLQAMLQSCGAEDAAREMLHAAVLQPYLDRVWQTSEQSRGDGDGSSGIMQQISMPESSCQSVSTSVITHPDFQHIIADATVDRERRIRMILVEGKLKSWGRAELVIKLLDQDLPNNYPGGSLSQGEESPYSLEDVIEAVRNCNDRNSARAYLTQECSTCYSLYPMSKIRSLNFCQCKICSGCLKQNFELVIREKHVRHWTCPICGLPDLLNAETAEEYLSFLGMLLKHQVDREVFELFDTKVRDWRLQKEPNFRWCAHCASGFLADERQLRMVCPHCGHRTCYCCKRMWEEQHEGLTCDQFAQWKIDNDPNNQAVGLARHLKENGIDCPSCKMRYALAKGGCMHFKCPQCGHEFCSGCYSAFYQKGTCPSRLQSCKAAGLHAHHPRDCFFYLRDEDVDRLQSLLRDHSVVFNTTPPPNQEHADHCPVIEQKEFDSCKCDEPCGKDTPEGHAGLCLTHYKEYLVGLINKNNIDPVTSMTLDETKKLLARVEVQCPKMTKNENEASYRKRFIKFVVDKIPLPRRGP